MTRIRTCPEGKFTKKITARDAKAGKQAVMTLIANQKYVFPASTIGGTAEAMTVIKKLVHPDADGYYTIGAVGGAPFRVDADGNVSP